MATQITKAEFDALPDSLKTKFTADGDNYSLVEEDVEGLKKSKATILEEKKALADRLSDLETKLKSYADKEAGEADEAAKKAGQFEELEAKLRAKIAELEQAKTDGEASLLNQIKAERVKNFLVENGVKADRAKYALGDVLDEFDIEGGEQGFSLKLKNGIGDAKELTERIGKLKETSPFLFDSTTASGSGASGSDGKGGGGDPSKMSAVDKIASVYAGAKN